MPAQDRLGLHDVKVLSPSFRPHVAKPDPEDSIRTMEARVLGIRAREPSDLILVDVPLRIMRVGVWAR